MAGLLELFRPGEFAERVVNIDYSALKSDGFELVILDLDNTLLPWKSSVVGDDVKEWVAGAKAAGLKLTILSNTHYPRRLSRIASELGIPAIAHALKPLKTQFGKAARAAGCERCRAVVVGDQLLTDILGGNLAGMRTILVRPVHPKEFVGTKISRMIEKLILSRLPEIPTSGTKSERSQSQTQDTS